MYHGVNTLYKIISITTRPFIEIDDDLSGKTKKLWSGQASLRRSGSGGRRKNQTKTMSPFVRRGDIIIVQN
jgi:hypothetical protein